MDVVEVGRWGGGGFEVGEDVEGVKGGAAVCCAEELAFADRDTVVRGLLAGGPERGDEGVKAGGFHRVP